MRTLNQSGATLIELMISVAISTVVVMALLGITSVHVGYSTEAASRADLSVDMMTFSHYFSRIIPSAGGELLPIWSGVVVENQCGPRTNFPGCNNTDRLTIVKTRGTVACSIRSSSAGGNLVIETHGAPTCCLQELNLNRNHVVLTKANGVAQRFVTSINTGTCSATVSAGPVSFNDNVTEPFDWSGGTLVPVELDTYYLNTTSTELTRFIYENGGGPNDGEHVPLADRVLDFQIALGFDFDPVDGLITNSSDLNDEYLFNTNIGPEAMGVGKFNGVSWTQLRMVALGLIIGQPVPRGNSTGGLSILDGPSLTEGNWMLESQVSLFMLRSTRTYQ